ncbi:uncharacterized protein LOC113232584 [Hyposmocoma kahamanoa]|uniref:uncharacterized protein LOC113232584 n=1 Tax=Hyposmocoma kahamanoa TaxID=1477025 RepID=UPI000E6D9051|nr:uncharacterized protein LOC113232584 [Hyposmocoma kahamanoa]
MHKAQKSSTNAKRARLDETLSPRGELKRQKVERPAQSRTYAEATAPELLAVITSVKIGYRRSPDSDIIQEALCERLSQGAEECSEEDVSPQFRGKPFYSDGSLKLWCQDKAIFQWLEDAISTIRLPTGEPMSLKDGVEAPRRVCGLLIPGQWEEARRIGHMLTWQNKWAEVHRWFVHRLQQRQGNNFVVRPEFLKLLTDAATALPDVVLYMAETDVPPPQEMVQLINHCEQNGQHIVVAPESNAHHPLWGMELANDRSITDSPLCRACKEGEETAVHILLECSGVANYRAKYLGVPRALPEVLSKPKRLRFLEELRWHEYDPATTTRKIGASTSSCGKPVTPNTRCACVYCVTRDTEKNRYFLVPSTLFIPIFL